jgi:sugar phosphate isomerase/epimerase
MEHVNSEKPLFRKAAGFSLKILNTNWGFNGSREAFFSKTKEAGYDGVELWVPEDTADRDDLLAMAKKHGLEFGLLCGGNEADFSKHLAHFEASVEKAIALKPLYINCHSGRDWFTFEQNRAFIERTTRLSNSSGIPIYHETHRARMLFAAHITRQFLEKIPDLRLTLDISHWCNVHESLLGDQSETVDLALSRTDHIHTRVGHAEGPQVNDPRAPEWETALKVHLAWWDKVVEMKAKAGLPLTMLTEFGPPNYLPALPYTLQPVADQWAINVHMKDLLRKRYK